MAVGLGIATTTPLTVRRPAAPVVIVVEPTLVGRVAPVRSDDDEAGLERASPGTRARDAAPLARGQLRLLSASPAALSAAFQPPR